MAENLYYMLYIVLTQPIILLSSIRNVRFRFVRSVRVYTPRPSPVSPSHARTKRKKRKRTVQMLIRIICVIRGQ